MRHGFFLLMGEKYKFFRKAHNYQSSEVLDRPVINSVKRKISHLAIFGISPMNDEARLEAITEAAQAFFGNDEAAKRWLSNPVRGLGDNRPVDMAHTDKDTKTTLNLILIPLVLLSLSYKPLQFH
jgi:putative toxin-antitoxin system antitoxin component (TIGR02293 family)